MIYIKGKKGNRHSSILHFFSGSVHFYLFIYLFVQRSMYDIVYIQNAGFIRPVMILCV